jgi:hypothetical protein
MTIGKERENGACRRIQAKRINTEEYREKRIIIITSPNNATCQFEHNGRVYSQKLKDLKGAGYDKELISELFKSACERIDKLLGPFV